MATVCVCGSGFVEISDIFVDILFNKVLLPDRSGLLRYDGSEWVSHSFISICNFCNCCTSTFTQTFEPVGREPTQGNERS